MDSNGWPPFRHRPAQQSLPVNNFFNNPTSPNSGPQSNTGVMSQPQSNRSSLDFSNLRRFDRNSTDFSGFQSSWADQGNKTPAATTPHGTPQSGPPKLQSSYSTSDLPTMKNTTPGGNGTTNPQANAQTAFHNHNASLGRIPPNGTNNRHSREISAGLGNGNSNGDAIFSNGLSQGTNIFAGSRDPPNGFSVSQDNQSPSNGMSPYQSTLHGGAMPFGPPLPQTQVGANMMPIGVQPFAQQAQFGYGMGMNMAHLNQYSQMYQQGGYYAGPHAVFQGQAQHQQPQHHGRFGNEQNHNRSVMKRGGNQDVDGTFSTPNLSNNRLT
jgi:hypothetical protein